MEKIQSRKFVKEKLALLDNKDMLSRIICSKVKALKLDCKSILLYKALSTEVNVDELIQYYLDKCEVYLPKVKGDDIVLIQVNKDTIYESGAFGIKEPVGLEINPGDVKIDICITPLLAFDESLNRLGKGKGYYDRFFSKCECKKIAVAFEVQKLDLIDAEAHDKKLDLVVTEERIYENN